MSRYYAPQESPGISQRKGSNGTETQRKVRLDSAKDDPFPGPAPIDPQAMARHKRGPRLDPKEATRVGRFRKKLQSEAKQTQHQAKESARSEMLLPEESGFLGPEPNERTYQITQKEISRAVDITSASKHFDLTLGLGPYRLNYFRNGRQLVVGGKRGHVAAFDWVTKDLLSEFNVMESVHDVQWLHMPTLLAVAQKDWVHIYDNKGTQIHCLKKLFHVFRMDFLPYHFLLVAASDNGFLSWVDVSMGKVVMSLKMHHANGRLTAMTQNPHNAVMVTGHPNGTVAMWSPNEKEPLVKMLCHPSAVKGVAVDEGGNYLATSGVDRSLRIWDVRTYKCLQHYKLRTIPGDLVFSQRNMLAVSVGNVVEIYQDCCRQHVPEPYLRHKLSSIVCDLSFSNFEDILGIGHETGFTSILVPGAGEPNFDAFESNPFMTTSQRREMEVKALLEKIQPQLISLDPVELGRVDVSSLKRGLQEKEKILFVKTPRVEFESRRRKKQTNVKSFQVKRALKEEAKKRFVKDVNRSNKKDIVDEVEKKKSKDLVERFKAKI